MKVCSVATFPNVCKIVLQMVTEHSEERCEGPMQLSDDDEDDLCKVWDMAMDKVEFLLQLVSCLMVIILITIMEGVAPTL